jgi:hypothetical protein
MTGKRLQDTSFIHYLEITLSQMSDKPNDDPRKSAERVVEHNEKFNVPVQTEKEEAQVFENASSEDIANEQEIRRKKEGLD